MSTEEVKTDQAMVEYDPIEKLIQEMRADLAGKVYDVSTGKGLDVARGDRQRVKKVISSLEGMRKALKAESLERGRKIDGNAKRLKAIAVSALDPIDKVIKAEEDRKAKAKEDRERQDRERVAKIQKAIEEIRTPIPHGASLEWVEHRRDWLLSVEITVQEYAEFTDEAKITLSRALETAQNAVKTLMESAARDAELEELRQKEAERKAKEEAEAAAVVVEAPEIVHTEAPEPVSAIHQQDPPGQPQELPEPTEAEQEPQGEQDRAMDAVAKVGRSFGGIVDGAIREGMEPSPPFIEPSDMATGPPVTVTGFMVAYDDLNGGVILDIATGATTVEGAEIRGGALAGMYPSTWNVVPVRIVAVES